MRRAFVVALVVMATACSKKEPAASSAASGSAVGSAAAGSSAAGSSAAGSDDPWSKPPPPPAAEAPCNDDEIRKHIEDSLGVSVAYLTALEKKTANWGKDCEKAKQDLLALEPEAKKFMDAMTEFMTWGRSLSPACGKRVSELGEQTTAAKDIEKRTPGLEAKIKPVLERCKEHPGFQDAAAKGLRVMHKKSAP